MRHGRMAGGCYELSNALSSHGCDEIPSEDGNKMFWFQNGCKAAWCMYEVLSIAGNDVSGAHKHTRF